MKVEIISIGDEILIGQINNTNAYWMAKQLAKASFIVHAMTTVRDDEKAIMDAFQRASRRSDIVLITGGLGPTPDDKTKGLLAKFFDLPIIFRNDLLQQVREVYSKRQLSFIETSREQAEFPEGATPIRNIHGTAPGIWIERNNMIFAAMPGVPVEMYAMMKDFVLPRLLKKTEGERIYFRTINTVGIKEAEIYEKLTNQKEIAKFSELAFLPSYSGVRLRLTVKSESEDNANRRLDSAETLIREKINNFIIGVGEDYSPQALAGEILKKKKWMLTVAESCTAGLLSKKLTDISGSSAWFERGFITYTNDAKNEMLGVPYELLDKWGAVSAQVVEAMAYGALHNSRAQVALSITGIAGPTGGTETKPVGTVYIGYADSTKTAHVRHQFGDDRHVNRERSATAAIALLIDNIAPREKPLDPHLI